LTLEQNNSQLTLNVFNYANKFDIISTVNKQIAREWLTPIGVLSTCALLSVVITYIMYGFTQDLLVQRLRERLTAIVATSSVQFNPNDLQAVKSVEDIDKPEFKKIVDQLWDIREVNTNIRFAYLMRRTEDQDMFEFIADAESLLPFDEADVNGNGVIDEEEELPMPGDPYDVTEYPVLRDEAFYGPIAERELYEDQWGLLLAAYAPIYNEDGNAIAIIGIDVLVSDFMQVTQATLLPFLLFVLFLIALLTILTLILVRIYNDRVKAMREIDRQKDELLSIVSHQLATPISAVKWNLEMMLDGDMGKLNKEQEEHLKTVYPQTEDLADLASMILDVSRIQLGRMKIDRTRVDFVELVEEVCDAVKPKVQSKKVKFIKTIPKSVSATMLDRRLCRMTLENLRCG